MLQDSAYAQLLNLIAARGQQWLRNRIELMASGPESLDRLADIAIAAHVCTGLRGAETPLRTFLRSRISDDEFDNLLGRYQNNKLNFANFGDVAFVAASDDFCSSTLASDVQTTAVSPAMTGKPKALLPEQAEAFLRQPIPDDRLDEGMIDTYATVLSLAYRFGAERPRFASARSYGDAFANCLRLADWAQRKGKLLPLVQMIFCLCLIDPDHDVREMLADVISSQRPDGSFPARIGFGTADQEDEALRPTLATVVALHMAIHRCWRTPRPNLRLAA